MDVDLQRVLFNLPPGKALVVDIQNEMGTSTIPKQIKRMLNHTGLDMMDPLRNSDIEEWITIFAENTGFDIRYDSYSRCLIFFNKDVLGPEHGRGIS